MQIKPKINDFRLYLHFQGQNRTLSRFGFICSLSVTVEVGINRSAAFAPVFSVHFDSYNKKVP